MLPIRYAVSLSATLLLGACAKNDEPLPAPVYLLDQRWVLTELDGQEAPTTATNLQLSSVDGTNAGKSFCNQYGGKYTLTSGARLTFSAQFSTYATCPEQRQETQYFTLLRQVVRYTVRDQQLYLYNDISATPILVFSAAE